MPMQPPPRDEMNDLGFGSVANESGNRLLNRDGSFNVYREGMNPLSSLSVYHWLLALTWPRFLALAGAGYVVANAVFACFYLLCGRGALRGGDDLDSVHHYLTAFFFSVHTLATIGYGTIAPVGVAANLLVVVESLVGLLGFALVSGLVFARFSRPVARVIYSGRALIAPYQGYTAFMFRLANGRSNQLIEVHAHVSVTLERDGRRHFHELSLERRKVVLFPLSWTVVHPIDEASPLWGLTEGDLRELDAEFLVTIEAIDETFSAQVHSRTSYKWNEIVWGARFTDLFLRQPGRPVGIDLSRLHDFTRVELPRHPGAPALSAAREAK